MKNSIMRILEMMYYDTNKTLLENKELKEQGVLRSLLSGKGIKPALETLLNDILYFSKQQGKTYKIKRLNAQGVVDVIEIETAQQLKTALRRNEIDDVILSKITTGMAKNAETSVKLGPALHKEIIDDVVRSDAFKNRYSEYFDDLEQLEAKLKERGYSDESISLVKNSKELTPARPSQGGGSSPTTTPSINPGLWTKIKELIKSKAGWWKIVKYILISGGGFAIITMAYNLIKSSNSNNSDVPPVPPKLDDYNFPPCVLKMKNANNLTAGQDADGVFLEYQGIKYYSNYKQKDSAGKITDYTCN